MPYKKRSNAKKSVAKYIRKNPPLYKSVSNVPAFSDGAMPKQFKTQMSYVGTITGSTTTVPNQRVYRANDLFDPDYTGTGHQPRGFDQLMAFYNHFVVTSSKITVTCHVAVDDDPVNLGIGLFDDATWTPASIVWPENPRMKTVMLNGRGGTVPKLTNRFNLQKFFGVTSPLQATQFQGQAGSGPTELAYYHIVMETLPQATVKAYRYQVRIDYDVVLLGPKTVPNSS